MIWFRTAFLLLATSIILGAFGAHALKNHLAPESLTAWQTGVMYLFIHSIALILTSHLQQTSGCFGANFSWINRLFAFGVLLFSGSIFLLTTKELHGVNVSFIGPLTPIGGVCFIVAWILAAVSFSLKRKNNSQ